MPSAYTAGIADGITFEQFALGCARAMGALIEMRDLPMNAPIPEKFEVSQYHQFKISNAQEEIKRLEAMTDAEVNAHAKAEFEQETERNKQLIESRNELRKKYLMMRKEAFEWKPPTPDHEHFRTFMLEQISSSTDFDCDTSYYTKNAPALKTGADWRQAKLDEAQADIKYHTEAHQKEIERTESRNKWIKDLRDSLKTK